MSASHSLPAWLRTWMSASAVLFFLLMLTAFSGYSLGAALLLAGGLAVVWLEWRGRHDTGRGAAPLFWSREDRFLTYALLAVFIVNAAAVVLHGDEGKYLDQGARYLLAVPVLYGLRRVPLRLAWIVGALALGTVAAGMLAGWQVGVQGIDRATGFVTSAIPFGDIALVMGFWCLMAAAVAAVERRWPAALLLLLAGLGGFYAMMASATRGSLVALPALLVLAALVLVRRAYWRPVLLGSVLVALVLAAVLAVLPGARTADGRYTGALQEWHEYSQAGEVSNNTVGPRIEAWKAALLSVPERPLLGWGHDQYDAHLQDLIAAGRVDPFVETLANMHNNFLEVWLHQGTLGLGALLVLLAGSFWLFWRRLFAPDLRVRVLACCGASLPASFAAFGLTQVILGRNNGVMFFLITLALLWALLRQEEARAALTSTVDSCDRLPDNARKVPDAASHRVSAGQGWVVPALPDTKPVGLKQSEIQSRVNAGILGRPGRVCDWEGA